jgi:hypothetical protein
MPLSASILSRLEFQHKTIEELFAGFTEEQLKLRSLPGKWSAFENLVHLFTYQQVFHHRIQVILTENNPVFERYVAENDPQHTEHLKESLTTLLSGIDRDRKLIFEQLRLMTPRQLANKGRHPVFGNLTVVQWSEFFLLHEAHHLFTIFKLLNDRSFTSD